MNTDVVLMAFPRTPSQSFPLSSSPAVQREIDLIEQWFDLRDDAAGTKTKSTNRVLDDSIQLTSD